MTLYSVCTKKPSDKKVINFNTILAFVCSIYPLWDIKIGYFLIPIKRPDI